MRLLRLLVSSLLGPLLLLIPPCLGSDDELGGEKAVLDNHLFSYNISHRQSVCHRYLEWRDGKRELKDALSGLELRPLMAMGDFFSYSDENGINREEPGLMAELMDALGESANFTWRSSFGVMEQPEDLNKTWTELLLWGIETYDIAVNWWDQSVERMEAGAAYVEPWFDGSVILVDEEDPPVADDSIDLLNWLKPYETSVWCMILLTIVLSALAYQLIEHLTDERDDRPFLQWFSDNVYLSSLNFTQNFEYAPSHVAGRIFGVSMGVWALVITATYTANLASLFVEDQRPALVVDSIDQAIALGIPICTFKGTNADFIIKRRYENAIRVPMNTELQGYQALKRGECGLVAGYRDNWLGFEHNTKYNPDCDLNWVGRTVEIIKSGFAVKADAGYKCSSLIREVLNIHMTRLISEGKLEEVWEKHRSKTRDQNCDVESSDTGRRQLAAKSGLRGKREQSARKLKGGSSAAAASGGGGSSGPSRLTLKQMLGTFFLHWFSTFIAILVALGSKYYRKVFGLSMDVVTSVEKVMYRKHGQLLEVLRR
ncbi:receptor subunit 1 [Seminavis robusta]|uniref:Receptor subunit 1 n=1 Tax=Seminavis robusta TaxID=568900 RepID=A0A9N8EKE9_9STRA|nr:receptor subunit 1 [Seminavis robusta]|eukprot:Sro1333_g263630.1 receptor subunit 1 (543) ;mRNA; f:8132-9933